MSLKKNLFEKYVPGTVPVGAVYTYLNFKGTGFAYKTDPNSKHGSTPNQQDTILLTAPWCG